MKDYVPQKALIGPFENYCFDNQHLETEYPSAPEKFLLQIAMRQEYFALNLP
jgi:hypothetical protein